MAALVTFVTWLVVSSLLYRRVRFPWLRDRGLPVIWHMLLEDHPHTTCSEHRDSCDHSDLMGCFGGGVKDQCRKGVKCSLRKKLLLYTTQSGWYLRCFDS